MIREPRADFRMAAASLHEVFVALVNEGFTEHQALSIIGVMLATSPKAGGGEQPRAERPDAA